MKGDATALAEAIHSGKVSASEAMAASLAACNLKSGLGAIAHLNSDFGIAQAAAFDNSSSNNTGFSFGGVPTLVKDLGGPFSGLPVACGSAALPRGTNGEDSLIAERFREAGLLAFGLTTTSEFGLALTSESAIGPVCRNPLAENLTAGGSSGGAAAAVAAGMVAIAHATDAGGSIRVPAACCGLVGMKPSRGSVPSGPAFGNYLGGIASEFAICRSVRDAERLFGAITGAAAGPLPPIKFEEEFPERLRISLVTETGEEFPTSPERMQTIEDAARCLEQQGHEICPVDPAKLGLLAGMSGLVFETIIAVNLAALEDEGQADFSLAEPVTQAVVEKGKGISGSQLWQTLQSMARVGHDFAMMFEDFDCLLTPMLSSAPKPLGSFPMDHRDITVHFRCMAEFAPMSVIANISGCPALTLPFGEDQNGLPLPIQLLAPMGHDKLLFKLAHQFEREERWQHRFPVAGMMQ